MVTKKVTPYVLYVCIIGIMATVFSSMAYAEGEIPGVGSKHEKNWLNDFEEKPSVTFSTMFKSGYLLVNGSWSSTERVLQSDLFVKFKNGVYFDLWGSVGLESKWDDGYDDEIDPAIGWTGKLGESNLSLDVGLCYFDIFPVSKLRGDDIFDLYAELSIVDPWKINSNNTLAPYIRTETMWAADRKSIDGETTIFGGLKHSLTLSKNLSINEKFYFCYDPGVFGLDSGFLGMWQGQLDWQISKSTTWNVIYLRHSSPINVHDSRDNNETVWGMGFTFSN